MKMGAHRDAGMIIRTVHSATLDGSPRHVRVRCEWILTWLCKVGCQTPAPTERIATRNNVPQVHSKKKDGVVIAYVQQADGSFKQCQSKMGAWLDLWVPSGGGWATDGAGGGVCIAPS